MIATAGALSAVAVVAPDSALLPFGLVLGLPLPIGIWRARGRASAAPPIRAQGNAQGSPPGAGNPFDVVAVGKPRPSREGGPDPDRDLSHEQSRRILERQRALESLRELERQRALEVLREQDPLLDWLRKREPGPKQDRLQESLREQERLREQALEWLQLLEWERRSGQRSEPERLAARPGPIRRGKHTVARVRRQTQRSDSLISATSEPEPRPWLTRAAELSGLLSLLVSMIALIKEFF